MAGEMQLAAEAGFVAAPQLHPSLPSCNSSAAPCLPSVCEE